MKLLTKSSWPGLIWTAAIFFLLSMDTHGMGEIGFMKRTGVDKFIHFFLFAIFTLLWTLRLNNHPTGHGYHIVLVVVLLSSAYGMGMEYYQEYFTNRSFSYWDGLADALGSILGGLAAKKSPYGNRGRNQN